MHKKVGMIHQIIFVVLLMWTVCYAEFDLDVERGRAQYEMVKTDSKMPRYGECWQSALNDLHTGVFFFLSFSAINYSIITLHFAKRTNTHTHHAPTGVQVDIAK